MAYDEDTKVFDVSKPNRVAPSATSRPIIVGHHPTMSDPMVNEEEGPQIMEHGDNDLPKSTSIPISMDDEHEHGDKLELMTTPSPETSFLDESEPSNEDKEKLDGDDKSEIGSSDFMSHEEEKPEPVNIDGNHEVEEPHESEHKEDDSAQKEPEHDPHYTSIGSLIPPDDEISKREASSGGFGGSSSNDPINPNDTAPLHIPAGAGPNHRLPKWLMWALAGLLALLIVGFLAIDLGLVKSDIKLPFHIFNKQKTSSSAPVTTLQPSPAPAPTQTNTKVSLETKPLPVFQLPFGWVMYERKEVNLKFAYPKTWKLTDTSTFGQIALTYTSPDYKTVPNQDNPTEYVAEGGKFYIQVTKTNEPNLDFLKGSNGYFFKAENQLSVDKVEGLFGSCGHYDSGVCGEFIQGGNLYEFFYVQPDQEIIKSKTGKVPVTTKDKYSEDFLKLLSSIDFTSN